jgi:sporulation protein YlmC with PRC-barrel domain
VDIQLGKKVISSDGKHVGHVDSLVVDYNTHDIQSIISRSGVMLTVDRIIPIEAVGQVDNDGDVHLTMPAVEVEQQQRFAEREFRTATPEELMPMPQTWMSGTGQTPIYFGTATDSLGYRDDTPFFSNAPLSPPDVEVESNLPEESTRINSGTDVVGIDGKKIGTVDDVVYSADGRVTGFVVKAGFLFHHDIDVPGNWIEEISPDRVRLRVTADQANETHDAT